MKLLIKVGIVFFLVILLIIPMVMIVGIAHERKSSKYFVVQEIASNFGQSQVIVTPYLRIAYDLPVANRESREKLDAKGARITEEVISVSLRNYEYYIPAVDLNVTGSLNVEKKYRRIYSTPVYVGDFTFDGRFKLNEKQLAALNNKEAKNTKAFLEFRVSDAKGLRGNVSITAGGAVADFEQMNDQYGYFSAIRSEIPLSGLMKGEDVAFSVVLPINGTSEVLFVPTGLSSTINLKGNWPHPSFYGNHLPEKYTVNDDGFTGTWNTSWLSGQALDKNGIIIYENQKDPLSYVDKYEFGVELIDTVDIYSLVNRAVKYGFLIIVLTFLAILMMEVLSGIRIHPVQYGLTGVALVIFYLLLLSLSEHVSFGLSYLVAATACISLIAFYLYFSFKSARKTAIFATVLIALYGVIYLLLNVSDYALLLGSVLIFAVVAVVMISTRHIDWYTAGGEKK